MVLHAVILADKLRGNGELIRARCRASTKKKPVATGTRTAKISPWEWMAGGRTKAIRWTLRRAWCATGCTGKGRRSIAPMSVPTRCIATAMPACSVTRSFLWSGDVFSTWETLKTQVPIAINTALTGIPLLGHRHRRLCAHQGIHRRAVSALVSVWSVLHVVPLARPHLETAPALGMEHRRSRAGRDQQLQRRAVPDAEPTAQSAGRADLPQVSGAALSHACLTL